MADPLKVVKVLEWGTPKDAKDIRKFMGLVNYLKKFTPQLAPHAQQLTRLTRKNSAWLWTKQQQDAFDSIKEICQNIQPLGSIDYSDHAPPIWVITDASKTGIGGILAQGENWKDARPIEFESQSYNNAEKNYPTHEQELLAVVKCIQQWRNMLLHTPFNIITDNQALSHLMTQRDLTGRQARWAAHLADYDFKIHHVPGQANTAANSLSRMRPDAPEDVTTHMVASILARPHDTIPVTIANIEFSTINNNTIKRISEAYRTDTIFGKAWANIDSIKQLEIKGTPPCIYFEHRFLHP
jgi:hypothetical protein